MAAQSRPQSSGETASGAPTTTASPKARTISEEKVTGSRYHSSDSGSSVVETSQIATAGDHDQEKSGALAKHAATQSQHSDPKRQIQTREDGAEYPTGLKLSLIFFALCLSVFLMALDNAIIATAIPKITDAFHSLPDVGWYGSAYLLTTAALQLLFGKLYTFLSLKWVYLTAIGVFELGSLICGVAQNSVTLIIGRAVAGLGSAGLMSGALLILAHSVPLAKRPMYTGIISSMYGIASVTGPLLGGAFTDKVSWRWCFYINLPIGAVAASAIAVFFPDPPPSRRGGLSSDETLLQRVRHFDPIGTVLFMPAVICLLLALQWGGVEHPWNSGRVIALFVVAGVLLLAFAYVQHVQQEDATVPPRILRKRTIWASGIFTFGTGAGFFVTVYYVPIWFQSVQGVSAVGSGIRNLPMLISVVLSAIAAGAAVTVFGYYAPFMILGTVIMSVGAGLLSTWTPDATAGAWIGYQVLFGVGIGVGMQQPLVAAQTVLDIRDVPTGAAVLVFVQTMGGALFVSVGQTVFTNKLVSELAARLPSLDLSALRNGGVTEVLRLVPPESLSTVILSYSNALTATFLVATGLVAFTVFGSAAIEWKSVKGRNVEAAVP
ncbi:putative efflux pump [Durotheca rogersii]|uniref:putative efflux pump n=1 Tax=Durotheca rogersii TaxID=419775 RepID=UPI00221EA068|nr:putative efflux pump [Durotheca rogersii]KAI5866502.1 putative efflux pump [Durotheca rogersii]